MKKFQIVINTLVIVSSFFFVSLADEREVTLIHFLKLPTPNEKGTIKVFFPDDDRKSFTYSVIHSALKKQSRCEDPALGCAGFHADLLNNNKYQYSGSIKFEDQTVSDINLIATQPIY